THHKVYVFSNTTFRSLTKRQETQSGCPTCSGAGILGAFCRDRARLYRIFPLYCQSTMEQRQSISLPRLPLASRHTFPPVRPKGGSQRRLVQSQSVSTCFGLHTAPRCRAGRATRQRPCHKQDWEVATSQPGMG